MAADLDMNLNAIDNATSVIGNVTGALGGLGSLAAGAVAAGLAAAAAGFAALGAGMVVSVSAAIDNEKIQAQLAQTIKSTGGAAGLTAEAANALAQQFTHLAGGSDDAILAIETIGLRAGTISAEQMPAFIQSVVDLGAVMDDTSTAAILLARAQDDPEAAFKRIERATGAYDSVLEEQIKLLVDAGDNAGAVALIMDKLADTTGGAAQAQAETLTGQWEILKGTLGEAAETIGNSFLPVAKQLFEDVIQPAIPVVTLLGEQIGALVTALLSGDMTQITAAFADLGNTFSGIWEKVEPALNDFITAALAWVQAQLPGWLAQLAAWGQAFVDWIAPMIPPLLVKAGELAQQFLAWLIAQAPVWIENLKTWGQAFVDWVAPQIPPLLAKAAELGQSLIDWLAEQVPILVEKLLNWGTEFVEWIGPQIPPMLIEAGKFLGELTAWLITTGVPALLETLLLWAAAFIDWVKDEAIPKIGPALDTFIQTIGDWVVYTGLPALVDFGKQFVTSLLEGLGIEIPLIVEDLKTLGGNIVQGITDGVLGAVGGLIGAVVAAVAAAIAAAKEALGFFQAPAIPTGPPVSYGPPIIPGSNYFGGGGQNGGMVSNYNLTINSSQPVNVPLEFSQAAALVGAY